MKTIFLVVFLLTSRQTFAQTEIVGGSVVPKDWDGVCAKSVVAITTAPLAAEGHSYCTGTVVGDYTILTAAHCLDSFDYNSIISFGPKVKTNSYVIKVSGYKQHPNWDGSIANEGPDYDVGVIYVSKKIAPSIPRARIAQGTSQGSKARIIGFGVSASRYTNDTGTLRYAETSIREIQRGSCRMAVKLGLPSIAAGDSGGPALVYSTLRGNYTVAGVASYGMERDGIPTGDTRHTLVKCFEGWLTGVIK